mgnify:CR=1 FL=1
MKPFSFLLQIILIIALGYAAHQFLPFWAIALAGLVAGLFFKYDNSGTSLLAGLLAGLLLWGGMAFYLDNANEGLLSGSLGALFSLNGTLLVLVTAIIGALLAGLGALTGSLARKMVG